MLKIVDDLKANNQDYEYYPTTPLMVTHIAKDIPRFNALETVLDIGAGNGNFKKIMDTLYQQNNNLFKIKQYMVIEKSQILLNQLTPDTMILGTDFYQTTLLDKTADVVFCNPPYSDYESWTYKILSEVTAKYFYFVIPERWKDSDKLKDFKGTVIYEGDFLDADRKARAKINIVRFSFYKKEEPFDKWFDSTFAFKTKQDEPETTEKNNNLVQGTTDIDNLIQRYDSEMQRIYNNYTALAGLDYSLFSELNISIPTLRATLKTRLDNTKAWYWDKLFNNLDPITRRLTQNSRKSLLEKIKANGSVDFNADNITAMINWVFKNAEKYYNSQIVDLFKNLSTPEGIRNYKSNHKVFAKDHWRWHQEEKSHYALDYRIIQTIYELKEGAFSDWRGQRKMKQRVQDVVTIANNLGFASNFECGDVDYPYGVTQTVPMTDGKTLLEFKIHKNGNVHYKFNIEFCKALNVEAGRLLGWLRNKAEAREEYPEGEKYFGAAQQSLSNVKTLMLTAN